jgi:VWFA-related protein
MSADRTAVVSLHGGLRRWALTALLGLGLGMAPLYAQESNSKSQTPDAQSVPEAGGPQGDLGPYSIPSKKKEEPPPEPVHPPKNPPEVGNFSVTKDVSLVTVPVMVTAYNGQFIPNLKEGNFRVSEDGVPQKITSFNVTQAPITALLLVEFADIPTPFLYDTLNAAYSFSRLLKPQDWVAVMYYDNRPHILTDFTQDKRQVENALNELRVPGFRDTNLYDALSDAIDRLDRIEGRKYIVLISRGYDTFSRITYDQMLKRIKGTKDVTIFAMSTGRAFREFVEARNDMRMGSINMDYLQADNQMNTFAKLTGGRAYFPRFEAEFPEDFQDMAQSIRNQYVLAYRPTNPNLDGTYRKLKVEVVDPQTGAPLKLVDQKGKNLKYTIVAREGYTAKHQVE